MRNLEVLLRFVEILKTIVRVQLYKGVIVWRRIIKMQVSCIETYILLCLNNWSNQIFKKYYEFTFQICW